MNFLLVEGGDYTGLVVLILAIMFAPAIIMTIIGVALLKKNKKAAKVLFILSAVYIIISLGVCGSMIA